MTRTAALRTGLAGICVATALVVLPGNATAVVPPGRAAHVLPWKVPGPTVANITGVSCPSGRCVAVGTASPPGLATTRSFAEVQGATGNWTNEPISAPTGFDRLFLEALSCGTPSTCIAVGQATNDDSAATAAVVVAQHGASWTTTALPAPTGAFDVSLAAISCVSTSCTAVGSEELGSDAIALVASLEGGVWTTSSIPVPSGSYMVPAAVSCADATHCTAIGNGATSSGPTNWVAVDASGTWTSTEAPASLGDLNGISCWAPATCGAVGSTAANLAEVLDVTGASVSADVLPLLQTESSSSLSAISCRSATHCVAVGQTTGTPGDQVVERILAATLSGTSWTQGLLHAPLEDVQQGANAIACWTDASCEAVGFVAMADSAWQFAYAAQLMGTTWTMSSPPVNGSPDASLASVACPSATRCVAIGNYTSEDGEALSMVETWNGANWKPLPLVPPRGLSNDSLEGVSCASASVCVAVGSVVTASGRSLPTAETLFHGQWHATLLPVRSTWSGAQLYNVSCADASSCTAVGAINLQKGCDLSSSIPCQTTSLVEHLVGGHWIPMVPAAPGPALDPSLQGVSCLSPQVCVAVGSYFVHHDAFGSVETLSDGKWRWSRAPSPNGGGNDDFLSGVSCVSVRACKLVGNYNAPCDSCHPGPASSLIETGSDHGPWAPEDPNAGSPLDAIACRSVTSCITVGTQWSGPPLAYGLHGGAWSALSISTPHGYEDAVALLDVTCPPSGRCMSVGFANTALSTTSPAYAQL